MLLDILGEIPDQRRAQGKKFELKHIILFTILTILTGGESYRDVADFIKKNFNKLKKKFKLEWKNPPAYTAIRKILIGIKDKDLEKAFRKHAGELKKEKKVKKDEYKAVGIDGKTLRGSFDNEENQSPIQLISAFLQKNKLILAHKKIDDDDKTNEIPKVKELIKEIAKDKYIFTKDALHCQKKQ